MNRLLSYTLSDDFAACLPPSNLAVSRDCFSYAIALYADHGVMEGTLDPGRQGRIYIQEWVSYRFMNDESTRCRAFARHSRADFHLCNLGSSQPVRLEKRPIGCQEPYRSSEA